jgi:GTP-dependent dephospho-CoA kinase
MPISSEDAQFLKQPFGTLVADKDVTLRKISLALKGVKKVISVGDATTERLTSFGITPDIAVIDGKERRSKRGYPNYKATELRCVNPGGTISKDAVAILQDGLKIKPPTRIIVDGEEDLLALAIFAMAPAGSVVLYGQPLEGLVIVEITPAKQKQAKDLMERICDNTNLLESPSANNNVNDARKSTSRPKNKHKSSHNTASRTAESNR